MNTIILGLGGNLGNRTEHLATAGRLIKARIGTPLRASKIYETAAWGIKNQPDFYNQVLEVQTDLPPRQVLQKLLKIEKDMGRVRERKWYTRLIDLDLLFYNQLIINEKGLIVPHPFLHERKFVLVPLAEIAPEFNHPVLQKTAVELLAVCPDPLTVRPVEPGVLSDT